MVVAKRLHRDVAVHVEDDVAIDVDDVVADARLAVLVEVDGAGVLKGLVPGL
jgi:hypothetical protein